MLDGTLLGVDWSMVKQHSRQLAALFGLVLLGAFLIFAGGLLLQIPHPAAQAGGTVAITGGFALLQWGFQRAYDILVGEPRLRQLISEETS